MLVVQFERGVAGRNRLWRRVQAGAIPEDRQREPGVVRSVSLSQAEDGASWLRAGKNVGPDFQGGFRWIADVLRCRRSLHKPIVQFDEQIAVVSQVAAAANDDFCFPAE